MYILTDKITFPPIETADESGFLAIGGDLTAERLLEAYRNGIFPWYNEEDPICWWSPDPRCVLFPHQLYISKSMHRVMQSGQFRFATNTAFEQVMQQCSNIKRKGEAGTWIHPEMIDAYVRLHALGFAVSAETWQDEKLVGGLYGIRIGNVFFGESMFSSVSNASKFAFINFILLQKQEGLKLVDCQMHTAHLESLGAIMIPRDEFSKMLRENT